MMNEKIVIIACSIFKYEIEYLKDRGKINYPIVYLNSMLHMNPQKLQKLLDGKVADYSKSKIILLFGDCHAKMIDYDMFPNIVRTPGINCCEIILGSDKYKKLRHERAFMLLPEWSERWKEAFIKDMGFKTPKMAQPFMREMHNKIVYIETGIHPLKDNRLTEIADFLGLPVEIELVTLDELEKVVLKLIKQQENCDE